MNVLTPYGDPKPSPTTSELQLVLDSLLALRAIRMEDGMVSARKHGVKGRFL